jgi:hypothetical protein
MDINKEFEKVWKEATAIGFHDEEELNNYGGNLFHYTTPAGLIDILQFQKFWASESSFLYGTPEITYGKNLAQKVLS